MDQWIPVTTEVEYRLKNSQKYWEDQWLINELEAERKEGKFTD